MILLDPTYKWQTKKFHNLELHFIGREKSIDVIVESFVDSGSFNIDLLEKLLYEANGHFACIMESEEQVIAFADKVRSYPVFYTENEFHVSNSPRRLKEECQLTDIDKKSLLEFKMSCYVTGKKTLYAGLYQIQAGELIIWNKKSRDLYQKRYFVFYPENSYSADKEDLIDELDKITNQAFQRIMEDAGGRPIWVPLSGGLDSRLVICKLKELGYDNLHTFSYGPVGNGESKLAAQIARRLNIPWVFVPYTMKECKKYFYSKDREGFWKYSSGLCSLPFNQDNFAFPYLMAKKYLTWDAVFINGQSGDFISGAHIPEILCKEDVTQSKFFQHFISKHFGMWLDLETGPNVSLIQSELLERVYETSKTVPCDIFDGRLFEFLEWQERQAKFVVNGQRIYDYYGYDWYLPLWENEYMHFWKEVPLHLKLNQNLYKQYLNRYDYSGAFTTIGFKVWRWPGLSILLLALSRITGMVYGDKYGDILHKYLIYFGYYRYMYGLFDYGYFRKHALTARTAESLLINLYLNTFIPGHKKL